MKYMHEIRSGIIAHVLRFTLSGFRRRVQYGLIGR